MKSIFKRNLIMNLVILGVGLCICLYLFYGISRLKGWGVAVDNAGRLRFNSQWPKAAVHLYYQTACVEKKSAQNYLERIEKSRKVTFKAIEDLKYGKDGSKAISSVSDSKAPSLFAEIEEGYKELFSLIDNLVKTCDGSLLYKIDEVSEKTLSKAMEFTPLLASESKKEMVFLEIFAPILILIILILMFSNFYFTTKNLKKAFSEIALALKNLEKGNFTFEFKSQWVELKGMVDTIHAIKRVLEGLLNSILTSTKTSSTLVVHEKEEIQEIVPISTQLYSLVEKTGIMGSELSDLLASIERSTEEMKLAISEISKNTHETADRAKLVRNAATEMEETVINLEKSMEEIRHITETIRGIAEQTNLLALNASIEAARAGEAGKGFAVVANEVKELAKKVSDFTGEIEKIVDNLSSEVKSTVEKAERTKQMVDEVEHATSLVASAVEEQTAVTDSIVENTILTKEKSFTLISEVEDLKKVVEKLKFITTDLEVNSELLAEINLTSQIAGHLFDISKRVITDDELQTISIQGLVNLAVLGHVNWKIGFLEAVIKGQKPQVEKDARRCLLGRSMHILETKFKGTPVESTLKALEEPHHRLHGLVEKYEREVKDKSSQLDFINNQVLPIFEEVMKHLLGIKEICKKINCN